MGYTTDFSGTIMLDPPLNEHELSFLEDFNKTRRMIRTKGPLFVKGSGSFGQGADDDIIDYNRANGERPHSFQKHDRFFEEGGQPGLWCQWVPTDDGDGLAWDEGEKFYNAAEWMKYLITKLLHGDEARAYVNLHILEDERLAHFTFDHVANGTIEADGEDGDDHWAIVVKDSVVMVAEAELTYNAPRAI